MNKDKETVCNFIELQNISLIPNDDLEKAEIWHLFDVLKEILIKCDLLSENYASEEENRIGVSWNNKDELTKMLNIVIDKIISIIDEYGILG